MSAVWQAARWIVSIAWELPQSALGLANLCVQHATGNVAHVEVDRGRCVVELKRNGAVSLGHFVFWTRNTNRFVRITAANRGHEFGHARQSRLLGPLYLIVVGVPSSMRAAIALVHGLRTGSPWEGYFRGFPEDWADRLGGVDSTR